MTNNFKKRIGFKGVNFVALKKKIWSIYFNYIDD